MLEREQNTPDGSMVAKSDSPFNSSPYSRSKTFTSSDFPTTPSPTRSTRKSFPSSGDGTIITPRRLLREQSVIQRRLRQWIEESLNIKFEEKKIESNPNVLESPQKKLKEESSAFYYNLESGVILW